MFTDNSYPPATPAYVQMCNNVVRHRLTLQLRAGRAWRRTKERLWAVALAPWRLLGRLLGELLKWALVAVRQVGSGKRFVAVGSAVHSTPSPQHGKSALL